MPKEKDSLISVIVPIYKVEKELGRCVDSILAQTHSRLEIILVDDGSPDDCPRMCDAYALRDPRIQVLHKENGGLSDARNAGLRLASGEFVLYVDSDDYLEFDACEKLLTGMLEDSVSFVVGAMRVAEGEKVSCHRQTGLEPGRAYSARDFLIRGIRRGEWTSVAILNLYRREFLLKNGLWFVPGRFYEDMEFLPRLYLAADNVVYVDHPFYNYVIRPGSITTSARSSKKLQDAFTNYAEWKQLFDKVEDGELQRALYGGLIKCYLYSCREFGVTTWKKMPCGPGFALKYSLNPKEKLKALLFSLLPWVYVRL